MSDGSADILAITGGSAGLEAMYAAVRALAETFDRAGDRLREVALEGARLAGDADLLESSLLSPATAVRAETDLLAATTGPHGLLVESVAWEAAARGTRACVEALEAADRTQRAAFEVIDYSLARQLGTMAGSPLVISGLPLAIGLGGEDLLTDHPGAVEHLVNGGGGLIDGLSGRLLGPLHPTITPTTEDAAAQLGALYPEGHASVVGLPVTVPAAQPASVEDLLAHLGEVAALSPGSESPLNGTIEIQTVTTAGGEVVHIVNLPGTDDLGTLPWTADGDVRDMGTNLDLIAGVPDDYQQGILQAMHDAGIAPDDPVLLVGHSQGGMEAAAIAASGHGFRVTDVVTAGSPTAQVRHGFPEGTNVLSIEQRGDLVPLLDGEKNPDTVHQTTVVVDAHPGHGITTHHGYPAYISGAAAIDRSGHPSILDAVQSMQSHGYLGTGGHVASQVFQITRVPNST
ncbi:alpha/beta hydrolase [Nocardioides sp.]|uniref:alpha/beta hydrolase n=1 Tax=Nocardioides sp. TaxID=35761 RepID=UPI0035662502